MVRIYEDGEEEKDTKGQRQAEVSRQMEVEVTREEPAEETREGGGWGEGSPEYGGACIG